MQRSTQATPRSSTRATVRLRVDRFDAMTRAAGASGMQEQAELVGVDRATLWRVRTGAVRVGEVFMARVVSSLRRYTRKLAKDGLRPSLDELFEVIEEPNQDGRDEVTA